jgi:penicillin-binding protein 2
MDKQIPARANIYDRQSHALVAQTDATAIGLVPGQVDPEQADSLYSILSRITGLRQDTIRLKVENSFDDWYVQLGEVPSEEMANYYDTLLQYSGVAMNSAKWRFYYDGGVAPHVIGYVGQIREDQLQEYLRMGYVADERVGQAGLEQWGEEYLGGKRGGTLYVYNAQGQPVTALKEVPVEPSQAIYTTLDKDFQLAVQQSIAGFRAAAVVLERDTGRVLALASSPGFDPNAFEPNNFNYNVLISEIFENFNNPLVNRATQGMYPLGSVFKIITMAAGLESGFYTPDSEYQCGYHFTELQGVNLNDWTWEHYQEDGATQPSGLLTLSGGLIRSCNPFFWHIGLDLYNRGLVKAVSDMARGFGLGSPTGINVVDEAAGTVPDPENSVDATNLAIGQGSFQTTPLQVANFVAAVGNGGTLYRPQLIEVIAPPGGDPTFLFEPEEIGKLPVTPENLAAIQDAMKGVASSTSPRGTAYHVFSGLDIPVAGKTGTAQSPAGLPHAWFAGYTDTGREDKTDIAIAVIVENIGEGSDYAAPIFRRIVEIYYRGNPGKLFPWETTYYVTRTPTSIFDETETPEPEEDVEEGNEED